MGLNGFDNAADPKPTCLGPHLSRAIAAESRFNLKFEATSLILDHVPYPRRPTKQAWPSRFGL
jgi:hypothetical protein